ncbi:MAG: hypothetical protein J7M13_01015 [Synergistetes bacterium]|nr:hypothetical protein [Synergistota bacterium]
MVRIKTAILIMLMLSLSIGLAHAIENPFLKDAKIKLANAERIAIIPFADYSRNPFGIGNRRLLFAIRQRFESLGKLVIPDEDVWMILKKMGVIPKENERKLILEEQLRSYGFSRELAEFIESQDLRYWSKPYIPSLTEKQIREIGKALKADIIVRGCIVDYGVIDVSSGSPISNVIGGIAPLMTARRIGIALAAGSYIPSSDKEGVVQMTIYLQDGRTGRLIYGKSVFATYKPTFSTLKSKFVLLRGALKRALDAFFNDFSMN